MIFSTKKKIITNTIVLCLSILLVVFLISNISIVDIEKIFIEISAFEIILISLTYVVTTILRGVRLNFTVNSKSVSIFKLIAFSAVHSFLKHLLPLGTGEVTLPLLFKFFSKEGLFSGASSLVIIRLYDLIAIVLFFVVSLLFVFREANPEITIIILPCLGLILIVVSIVIIFFEKILHLALNIISNIALRFGEKGRTVSNKIHGILEELNNGFYILSKRDKYIFLPITSIMIWFSLYFMFFMVVKSFAIDITFIKSILASSGAVITSYLPINGLGNIGTLEAGWALGYTMLGVSKNVAIASGFVMHIIIVVIGLLLSIISAFFLLGDRFMMRHH